MKPKSIAIVGAAETTRLGVIPDMSQIQLHADAALNAMADAGLRPADIDGIATAGETPVTVAHYLGLTPKWVDGTAVGGCSFMIHVRHAAAAIEFGSMPDGADHAWRERPLRRRAHPQRGVPSEPRRPVRAALWPDGAADFVHDSRAALHEDLWADARDPGDGLGRAARMGGQKPARHFQDADHGRGCTEFADDRLPVPATAVLPGDRWRRRIDPGRRRARPRLPAKAGLPAGHRRERRDPDGQPNGGFHLLARVPRRRPHGLCRGRHHPQRRRPL